ncbi:MAG: GH116 family glycosyl hydrolase, partial [Mariniphaga sp.]
SDDSGMPVVVMQFTVKNTSSKPVEAYLTGLLENAVCLDNRTTFSGKRINKIVNGKGFTFLECSVEKEEIKGEKRPDKTFEDWNKSDYTDWTTEGTAFGNGPIRKTDIPSYQGDVGGDTERVVNSHATAPGASTQDRDKAKGKLISNLFTIDRNYINFWIGGGSRKGQTCINLIVDNKVVHTKTGQDNNQMTLQSFFVKNWEGKEAHLEIVDSYDGGWGNIGIGKITFSDSPAASTNMENLPDFGTMGLALLGNPAEIAENKQPSALLNEKTFGTLGRKLTLASNQSSKVTFLISWFFPNLVDQKVGTGRYYSNKFNSAYSVAGYVSANFEKLSKLTRLWRDTWYDSTLPFWFLDRTFVNTSTLATSTCYRYSNGRFWAWEGVGCCQGTCTHVWHYAQAMARIFPDIERDIRQRVDLGLSLNLETGVSGFRGEYDKGLAIDGQSGTILRIYREHQMSADNTFLKTNWNKIKLMFNPLFIRDPNNDGILEGDQMNTLDRPWFGKISWLSSMYLAALRAGEAMAIEMGEPDFATRCRQIVVKGRKNMDEQLFNGEYYYQTGEPGKVGEVGSYDGCEIDQVLGQSWVFQVGLPRVLDEKNTKTALESLWKYNFALDAGLYRKQQGSGRVYAMEGEAGLLMCSWPKGDSKRVKVSYDFYFNECMTGFEYQAAGHMIGKGCLRRDWPSQKLFMTATMQPNAIHGMRLNVVTTMQGLWQAMAYIWRHVVLNTMGLKV